MMFELTTKEAETIVKSIETEIQFVCKSIAERQFLKKQEKRLVEYLEKMDKEDKTTIKKLEYLQNKIKKEIEENGK